MPRLPLVPLAELPAPLGEAVQRGIDTRMLSSTVPVQVWAHRPQAALAWLALLDQFHNHGVLDARLRELVRLRIASITQCQACQLARKSDRVDAQDIEALNCLQPGSEHFTPAERAALTYAELFAADAHAVDEQHFAALAAHFSTAETVELQMFCALMLAGGRMTLVQQAYEETTPMSSSIFDIPLQALDGSNTSLAPFKGQVILVVNVASKCGLTPQYAGLQALYDRFHHRGLQVTGFPCNDFAGQEPGSDGEIRDFCDTEYHVNFPLFSKLRINSEPRHPLYAALIAAQPQALASGDSMLRDTLSQHQLLPKGDTDVMWNFEKFLIDRDGVVVARFAPDVTPDDARLISAIEDALG